MGTDSILETITTVPEAPQDSLFLKFDCFFGNTNRAGIFSIPVVVK